jgi:ribosomal protein L11 methyltransferase
LKNKLTDKPSWWQFKLEVPESSAEDLEGFLLLLGAQGLNIEDDEVRRYMGVPFKPGVVEITASFREKIELDDATYSELKRLNVSERFLNDPNPWYEVEDKNWAERFLQEWKPLEVAPDVWIVPTWLKETFKPQHAHSILIYMDPGMAFGTGHHETTVLCSQAIANLTRSYRDPSKLRVLDVGTGTGILALVALKLGAGYAVGTDIDELALHIAKENAALNGVTGHLSLKNQDPNADGAAFDIVVANILAAPLIDMAELLRGAMAPLATLFLSGLLTEQEDAVQAAFLDAGLTFVEAKRLNGWSLLVFKN